MDETLKALGGLLLRAIPTFLLLVLLHFYLKLIFFRPLEKVLRERNELTEGARRAAAATLEAANGKAAEYEAALREVRGELFREHDQARRHWREEQAAAIQEARAGAEEMVRQAREQLAGDAERAREALRAESDALAVRIAQRILEGRAS